MMFLESAAIHSLTLAVYFSMSLRREGQAIEAPWNQAVDRQNEHFEWWSSSDTKPKKVLDSIP